MKTIIDAVNEFKGIWPDGDLDQIPRGDYRVILECIKHISDCKYEIGSIIVGCSGFIKEYYREICDKDEFNQCVEDMSKAEWIKPVTLSPIYAIGDKVTLIEDTNLYSCHHDVICGLSAGDAVTVVGHGVRPDNKAPLITITNGKGFATLNPNYITPHVDLIDGEAYQFECDMLDDCLKGIYRKMNNSFYNYNGDFGVEHCTNIKLLETKS